MINSHLVTLHLLNMLTYHVGYIFLQGEKNNGFDVLYHNMKYGQVSSKDFSDFLKER